MVEANKVAAPGSPESQTAPEEVHLLGLSQITDRIISLQESLAQNLPNYEGLLQIIHRQLAEDEALVHLLKPDQVGTVVRGLVKKKNVILVKAVTKTAKKVKASEVTVDDI